MQPDVRNQLVPEGGMPAPSDEAIATTAEFIPPYYATVASGSNLERGTYRPRDPSDDYARVDRAIYPIIDTDEITDPLLQMLGREGLVGIISNAELGLMHNFESEYVPELMQAFEKHGVVDAMKAGRPVILGADHDNWVSTALLAIGAAHALRLMNEDELASQVALSVGYAAASFDRIKIKQFELDHMQAINMFVDIIKSFPNSQARDLLPVRLRETGVVDAINAEARRATDEILKTGSLLVTSISGTHDKEDGNMTRMVEPGPGTAIMLFSDEVVARNPLYIPCSSLCNPFRTGEQKADEGKIQFSPLEFEIDAGLDLHERMQQFFKEIQILKARQTRNTVVVTPHKGWDRRIEMEPVTFTESIGQLGVRTMKAIAKARRRQ